MLARALQQMTPPPDNRKTSARVAATLPTYLFVPSPTQLQARVVQPRRQAISHPHRVVHAVRLLVYREVAHVRPWGHRRAHGRPWLQLGLGLVLVRVVMLRMVLYLGILWRLLLVLRVLVLLVLVLVLVLVLLLVGVLLNRPRVLRLSLRLLLVVEAAHAGEGQ